MRKIFGVLALCAFGFGCEEIPDCTYKDECTQVLANKSNDSFSGEAHKVLTMKGRDELPGYFQIYQVKSPYRYPAGTIVVDTPNRVLYLMEEQGLARRYPIAVGKEGYQFEGQAEVGRKVKWPLWYPTPDMREKNPNLPDFYEGGEENPLGARAIYLYDHGRDTLYRIHGNNQPSSIGHQASSGCIRMYNEDVIDLYDRVQMDTPVVVIGLDDVPDDVKVDVIGGGETIVEERELTPMEQFLQDTQFFSSSSADPEEEDAEETEEDVEGDDDDRENSEIEVKATAIEAG